MNNDSNETQKSRKERAEKKWGSMNGPPIICKYMHKYPQVLRIEGIIPVMHGKIHLCAYVISPCLHKLKMDNTPGWRRLLSSLESHRDSLEHGKLCTNASGLFDLSKRFVIPLKL